MPRKHGPYASVREAILATAAQLFTQQGVHGTSLGDIAAAADLSKGTLYYYYPAKEELVLTIGEGCLSHFTDGDPGLGGRPPPGGTPAARPASADAGPGGG